MTDSRMLSVVGLALAGAFATTAAAHAGDKDVVEYEVVDLGIPEPLTDEPGDPERGKKLVIDRKMGNCLACHKIPIPEAQFHGEVGTDLSHIGSIMPVPQMRLRLVDSKAINPDTSMPGFYVLDSAQNEEGEGFTQIKKQFAGQTMLTAQQIEDIVAYLASLK